MRATIRRFGMAVAVLGLTAGVVGQARAALALDFTGPAQSIAPGGNVVVGWDFTTTSPLTVSAPGRFDEGGDGLAHAHDVGLWTGGGTRLASATLSNGTVNSAETVASASGFGNWVFTDLASTVTLSAGDYVVGATYSLNDADTYRGFVGTVTTMSGVSFAGAQATVSGSLVFPSFNLGTDSYFGPNLLATEVASVPEPSTLAGAATAVLMSLGYASRRRRARRAA